MHRIVPCFVGLLLTAGCGQASPAAPPAPVNTLAAPAAWQLAQEQIKNLRSGSYEIVTTHSSCGSESCDEHVTTTTRERGRFTTDPGSIDYIRDVHRPATEIEDALDNQVRFIVSTDGSAYMRGSGSIDTGCWVPMPSEAVAMFDQTLRSGLEVLRGTEVLLDLPLPGTIYELPARAPAVPVLQSLGLVASTGVPLPDAAAEDLASTTAPITVSIRSDGTPLGFVANGSQVFRDLSPGGLTTEDAYLGYIGNVVTTFELHDLGKGIDIEAPAAELVRPEDASHDLVCPSD